MGPSSGPAKDELRVLRVGGSDRRPALIVAAVAIVAIGIAIVKPWPTDRAHRIDEPSIVPAPPTTTATPTPTPRELVDQACYLGTEWRLFTVDTNGGRQIHTWYSVDPTLRASGPEDPAVPFVRVYSEGVEQLGYCAITVPGGIRKTVSTEAWALAPDGSAASIPLSRLSQYAPDDPNVGVLYAPPHGPNGTANAVWPAGRYAFVVRYGTRPVDERWFGVEIIRVPRSPSASPTPG
jgi:hypothetical protein